MMQVRNKECDAMVENVGRTKRKVTQRNTRGRRKILEEHVALTVMEQMYILNNVVAMNHQPYDTYRSIKYILCYILTNDTVIRLTSLNKL